MLFMNHSDLAGKHSFMSASNNSWINYDDDKIEKMYGQHRADLHGSQIHDLAHRMITLGVTMGEDSKTLSLYVNDAIRLRMTSEQTLYYSHNAFGTADTISFRDGILRIHDLKTGRGRTTFTQLEVYAALFCLEYDENPLKIRMEFRIYQNDRIKTVEGDALNVRHIMDRIVSADKIINKRLREELM